MGQDAGLDPEPSDSPGAYAPVSPDAPRGKPNLSYIPALDGIRAFAVLGVMVFHGGLPFLPAGFLGVDTFFVLSGFLITTLLLGEWRERTTIKLRAFWARRARRLLPALLLVVLFVACYAAFVVPKGTYPDLRLDAFSTLFYVANWHFIAVGTNYFVQTGPVSLLTHTWSLAIEEQFYLVWPLVVLGLLKLTKNLRVLLAVCVLGALASAVEMAVLYHPGTDPTRLYYGTDTHAQCLLVGAALAVGLAMIAQRRRLHGTVTVSPQPAGGDPGWAATSHRIRLGLAIAGGVGAVGSAVLWWRVSYTGSFLWRGGFLVAAVSTAAVLACVVCSQQSRLATALSVAPLRFLGRISYGLYLWHFPLFQWIDGERTGLTGYSLFGIRFMVTLAVATASFYLVERPIRHGDFLHRWRAWVATPVAFAGVVAIVVATTAGSAAVAASAVPTAVPPAASAKRPISVGLPLTPAAPPEAVLPGSTVVLLVGDSTAVTLGFGLAVDAKRYNATFIDGGIIECGVGQVTEMQTQGMIAPPGPHCRPSTPLSARWPVLWATWIHKYHPEVVAILFGRWEVSNVEWHGQWTDIRSPAFAAYVKQQLEQAVHIASSHGAHVALLDAPCYNSGEQPNGEPWPSDAPARLAAYNGIVDKVASANPKTTTLVNLNRVVCPAGKFETTIDNLLVRAPDGVHFPWFSFGSPEAADPDTLPIVTRFGSWVGPKLWPEILTVR